MLSVVMIVIVKVNGSWKLGRPLAHLLPYLSEWRSIHKIARVVDMRTFSPVILHPGRVALIEVEQVPILL
jgi:hypothetical protein